MITPTPSSATDRPQRRSAIVAAVALAATLLGASAAPAAVLGPYTADANTLHLYHFDELPGATDPGTPFADTGVGTAIPLTNTGGPDGRDNTGGGGYSATGYTGFGSAFNVLPSGNNVHHGATQSTVGGGAMSGSTMSQTQLQSATGAFTWEAVVRPGNLSANTEYTILAHDGPNGSRGPLFRIIRTGGVLSLNWYNGGTGVTLSTLLPTTGDHAFAANEWFHVAATYTGEPGAGSFNFYWTALDSGVEVANLLASLNQTADTNIATNLFGVGTTTRDALRFEWEGLIDEVRISNIARGAGDFIFGHVVPEPASAALLGLGALTLVGRRRRATSRA